MGTKNSLDDDRSSLAASVVKFAEKASNTDSHVSELKARLDAFKMGTKGTPVQQYAVMPPQAMYYMPKYSYMPPQQMQPPNNIQFNRVGMGKKQKQSQDGGKFTPNHQTAQTQQYSQPQGRRTNFGHQPRRGEQIKQRPILKPI
jgi:hypothetical protein